MIAGGRTGLALLWALRIGVAAIFVWAAVPKLLDPQAFAQTLRDYQTFPPWSIASLAAVVPLLELGAGLALCVDSRRGGAGLLLSGFTLAMLAVLAGVILRGIDVRCGCFGRPEDSASVGWPLFFRDVVLLAAVAVATWWRPVNAERR